MADCCPIDVEVSDEVQIEATITETEIVVEINGDACEIPIEVECVSVGCTGEITYEASFPKYILTYDTITVGAHGQYVLHGKSALTLNGTSVLNLEQGSEIII